MAIDREGALNALTREFCDRLNEWMAVHDREGHGGEPCHKERGNVLAYVCHRMGYSRETLIVMLDRLKDYEAIHAEQHAAADDDPHHHHGKHDQ